MVNDFHQILILVQLGFLEEVVVVDRVVDVVKELPVDLEAGGAYYY